MNPKMLKGAEHFMMVLERFGMSDRTTCCNCLRCLRWKIRELLMQSLFGKLEPMCLILWRLWMGKISCSIPFVRNMPAMKAKKGFCLNRRRKHIFTLKHGFLLPNGGAYLSFWRAAKRSMNRRSRLLCGSGIRLPAYALPAPILRTYCDMKFNHM